MRPCQGVSRHHLVEDVSVDSEGAAGFGSVVRAALRTYEGNPDVLKGDPRWGGADVHVRGCLAGQNGGVLGVLGSVGREDVFWSRNCAGVATRLDGVRGVARCSDCMAFYCKGVTPRTVQASRHTPGVKTRNVDLSTAQKVGGSSED